VTVHCPDTVDEIDELVVVEALMLSREPMPSLTELLRPSWQAKAACRSEPVDLFFPHEGTSPMQARRICNRCPVADDCLQYALERPSLKGIWAGTSERRRRRLRAQGLGAKPASDEEERAVVEDVV
jgi:WhiB family transcriptional regulator, redox-sensing transcriptional regulator